MMRVLVLACLVLACSASLVDMQETVSNAMTRLREAHRLQAVTPGQQEFTLQVDTFQRTYYVWVPKSYDGTKAFPVHLSYHGLGDDCLNFASATGFQAFAEQRGFLFVYPCSTTGILGNCWNAGVCCCEGNGADDVKFTRMLIDQMKTNFNIDSSRIFASGFSNGAFMAEILGCVAPDIFTATASVSGVVELSPGNAGGLTTCTTDYQNFTQRVSTVNIHGTLDFVVPYTGDSLLGFPPIPDDFSAWGTRNGCTGNPVQTFSNGTFSNQIYQSCDDGTVIELVTNAGGGHEWPSTDQFDTSTYICDFFKL